MQDIIVVIPSYEPSNNFIGYVEELLNNGIRKIIIVNDGSPTEFNGVFDKLRNLPVTILEYSENRGKGYALKTAFSYVLENYTENHVVITADCDGQHLVKDVLSVANTARENSNCYVLGSRDFSKSNVPKRSRFGNVSTRVTFNFLYGIKLKDTQTGLRGFSSNVLRYLINVSGNRFEYEMNAIIYLNSRNVKILETPISTVYEEKPSDVKTRSHFKTISDSVRVWSVLFSNVFKYFLGVLISGVIEIGAFALGVYFLFTSLNYQFAVSLSSVYSRVLSSIINYFVNFKYVFKGKDKSAILRYYILWATLLILTTVFNTFLNFYNVNPIIFKLIVDLILAIFSYRIQTVWVFSHKN